MDLTRLSSEELRQQAAEVFRPRQAGCHWSIQVEILGTVEDRRLYSDWGYASTRSWAEDELDVCHDDCFESLKLWRLMAEGLTLNPPIDLTAWQRMPKGRALIILKAVKMGGDLRAWFERALAAENEEELRAALVQAMGGGEAWVALHFDAPTEIAELLEAAMILALRDVFPGEAFTIDAARAMVYRREVAFRCLEVLAANYVKDTAAS